MVLSLRLRKYLNSQALFFKDNELNLKHLTHSYYQLFIDPLSFIVNHICSHSPNRDGNSIKIIQFDADCCTSHAHLHCKIKTHTMIVLFLTK